MANVNLVPAIARRLATTRTVTFLGRGCVSGLELLWTLEEADDIATSLAYAGIVATREIRRRIVGVWRGGRRLRNLRSNPDDSQPASSGPVPGKAQRVVVECQSRGAAGANPEFRDQGVRK